MPTRTAEKAHADFWVLIPPGTERELLAPLPVRTLPGIGPATAELLRRAGITTVGETARAGEAELLRLLGKAHGASVHAMASGVDERPVVADRDHKSISVEDTFDVDVTDRARIRLEVARLADRCVGRLRAAGRSGRTIVLKVRRYDFSTLTRSETLRGPTDDPVVVREAAERLLEGVDTTAGGRGRGAGGRGGGGRPAGGGGAGGPGPGWERLRPCVFVQVKDGKRGFCLARGFGDGCKSQEPEVPRRWLPGLDVTHGRFGAGWVQGSGVGRVTVRFERPGSGPGRVRTFAVDDPELISSQPLPLAAVRPSPSVQSGRSARSPGEASRPKSASSASSPRPGTSSP